MKNTRGMRMAHPGTSDRSSPTPQGAPALALDTGLIAAVQMRAGARCHRSANLLNSYYMCAEVYRSRMRRGDVSAADAARQRLFQTEGRLREFLSQCLPLPSFSSSFVYA